MRIQNGAIDTLRLEERLYAPDPKIARTANAKADLYDKALEEFWDDEACRRVSWFRSFEKLYEWDLPYATWFLGGQLNACFNCVGQGEKVAFYWEWGFRACPSSSPAGKQDQHHS
jgi:acetyl-CoA synthetase